MTLGTSHPLYRLLARVIVLALVLQQLLFVAPAVGAQAAAPVLTAAPAGSVPLLVKFRAGVSNADIETTVRGAGGQQGRGYGQIRTHVVYVPANAAEKMLAAYQGQARVERASKAVSFGKAGVPNDPQYAQQWALPKIAWDQAYGSVGVSGTAKIAVLDTGVDAAHPDLAGRLVAGQSFVNGDATSDPNGHGTALAGIAAANVNDATGMAGVAYAGASVAPVQVLGADGTGLDSDIVGGVLWAADNGAKVILMGFSSPAYSAALADAINYAWGKGAVLVAATGNDGSTAASYPAGMPNVIGVAATDQNDAVAASSNTGSAAVAAPGAGILATRPGGGYGAVSGTSASSAEVAGLAALLLASGKSKAETSDQLRGAVDPVAGQPFGRINVSKALGTTAAAQPTATVAPTPTPGATPVYTAAAENITIDNPDNNRVYNRIRWDAMCSPAVGGEVCGRVTGSGSEVRSVAISVKKHGATAVDHRYWNPLTSDFSSIAEMFLTAGIAPADSTWSVGFNGSNFTAGGEYTVAAYGCGTTTAALCNSSTENNRGNDSKKFTIDNEAPTVAGVSSSKADGAYKAGALIPVTVTFSEAVTVNTTAGTPQLTLETGATDRVATYVSGSGTTTLTFNYTVQAGDTSSDLDYTGTNALTLNGGTIKDAAGNDATLTLPAPGAAGSLSANKALVIDTTAPETTITAQPSNPTNSTSASFTFQSNEAGSTFECRLDPANPTDYSTGWASCTSPKNYTALANGSHTFQVRATDLAGNTDASPASYTWTISSDTTPPTVTINQAVGQTDPTNNATINFTVVFSEPVSGFDASDVTVGGTAGGTKTVTVTGSGATYNVAISGMTDGTVVPTIVAGAASDAAGNTSTAATSTDNSVTYDATAPSGTVSINGGATYTNSTSVTLTLSHGGSGATQMRFSDDGTAWSAYEAYATSKSYTLPSGDGTKTVYVQFKDAAGNESGASGISDSIVLDTSAPLAPSTPDLAATSDTGASSTDDMTSDSTPTFTGSAEANSTVALYDGGTLLGTATANGTGAWSFTAGTLADGAHSITATATDAAGNTGAASGPLSVTIDTSAPAAPTVDLPTYVNSANQTAVTITISGEAGATVSGAVTSSNGGIPVALSGTIPAGGTLTLTENLSGLADGTLTASATLTDAAGNTGGAGTDTATKDTSAPETTITAQPGNPTNSTSASFSFTGADNVTPADSLTFQCSLDGAAYAVCTSPASYSNLSAGSHTFTIKATDATGNTDATPASYTWTVDTTAPTVTLSTPALGNDSTPTFSGSAETGSGNVTVKVYSDTTLRQTLTAPVTNGSYSVDANAALVDGSYTAVASQTDAAGNTGTSSTVSFTVDTSAPAVTVSTTASEPTNLAAIPFTVTFSETVTGFEAGDITVSGGSVTTGSFQAAPDGTTYSFTVTSASDGTVTVSVAAGVAQDAATNGNSASNTVSRTSDRTAPTLTTTVGSGPYKAGAIVTVTVGSSEPLSGIPTVTVTGNCIDTAALTVSAGGQPNTWTASYTVPVGTTDCVATVSANGSDSAGNASTGGTGSFGIDRTAPVVTIDDKPAAFTNNVTASFRFGASESSTFQCTLDSNMTTCTNPQEYTGLGVGNHTFSVVATDAAGNTGSASYTWRINAAPTLDVIDDKAVNEQTTLTFTASGHDDDLNVVSSESLRYSLVNAPDDASINSSTGEFSWVPTEAQGPGSYTFTVRVTDSLDKIAERQVTVTVNEVNVAPVLVPIGNKSVDEQATLSFTASATDGDIPANTLTFSLDGTVPAGASINPTTGAFSWTPTEAQGPGRYTFTVKVTDNGSPVLSAQEEITITVAEVNQAPVLAAIGNKDVDEGSALTFTATATDGDVPANTLTFSLVDAPAGASIDASTGAFSWTPTDNGRFTFTVKVTDNGTPLLSDEELITVTVANVAPTATFNTPSSVDEGSAINLSLTNPSDPSSTDTTTGFAYAFDCGSGYGAASGTSTASCPTTDNGSRTVKGKVTDKDGDATEYTAQVTVNNVAPTATINGAPASSPEGTVIALTSTVSDAGTADTHTYAWSVTRDGVAYALPVGTVTNASSFSFTPADNGSYVVSLTVTDDDGGAGSDSKPIAVTNVAPTATLSNNGPVDEGSPVTVSFSNQADPSSADTGAGFHYAFSCANGDLSGATYATSGTASSTTCTFTDNGTYTVKARIIDQNDGYTEYTTAVTVTNVAPTVNAGADATIAEGGTFSSSGSFADAGADTWTATVDYGDGSPAQSLALNADKTFSLSHTYADNGTYTVTVTVTDDDGGVGSDTATVTVTNANPVVSTPTVSPEPSNEGSAVTASATFSDANPNDGPFFCTVNYGDGSGNQAGTVSGTTCTGPAHTYADNGTYTVTVTVTDKDGGAGANSVSHVVNNVAPIVGPITAPIDPVRVNTSISASASFTDPGTNDTHTAIWSWGDGYTSPGIVTETNGSGSVNGSHTYAKAGVYTITLTVTDKDGGSHSSTYQYVVVYDPNGGFVTGGGWINSPRTACKLAPICTDETVGRANFGFVSKYQKGANVPTGETEFQFKAGNLNFHSTAYQWLVISGGYKAQYKGTGTINGTGNYGFLVTVHDGQAQGGDGKDKFRIKIWVKNADGTDGPVVYDNTPSASDDINIADPQIIAGGSIVIHTK